MASSTSTGSLFSEAPGTSLEGVVRRVVYSNAETAWSVIRFLPATSRSHVTVVGPLFGVQPGERLRLAGEWIDDRQFGRQFRVVSYVSLEPKTLLGIERFLGSGLIPGIGRVMAKRLVDRFGLQTLAVIESEADRLTEVRGIGAARAKRIQQAWQRQMGIRGILIFLQSQGIGTRHAARIYRHFGEQAVAVLKSDPYRLAGEVSGFGFQTADEIASRLGVGSNAPARVDAGVLHALRRAESQGHMFLPEADLLDQAAALLALTTPTIGSALHRLSARRAIIMENRTSDSSATVCYLPTLFDAEVGVASRVRQLFDRPFPGLLHDWERRLDHLQRKHQLELSPRQREAVRRALDEKMLVITGGPGTGKTTLVRAVVELHSEAGSRVLLAAPTGRAAKRLSEATGVEAKTIHRLLEFDPHRGTFQRCSKQPLDADVVVVDETSMLDCPLARRLLDAVPDAGQLIFVGDVDQLPSVGPGRVLADVIDSGVVPVVRLLEVFRQAAQSLIVANAHRIRRGRMPKLDTGRPVDFYFIERRRPEEILDTLRHLLTERIPRRFGFDPRRDIQLLTPMRKGLVGVEHLNVELQGMLNPDSPPLQAGRGRLRRGDRVMQVRNNYDLDVFNGDVGHLLDATADGESVSVDFYGRRIDYPTSEVDDLVLAYACSVHKSQGSEYPCVVIPLHSQHHLLLQRNLLYTAVTRGQRLVILLGQSEALARAVRNDRPQERFTRLSKRLRGTAPSPSPSP